MIRRIFTDEPVHTGEQFTVSGEDGHHLARVLRVRVGEELSVASPAGVYAAVVEEVGKAEVQLAIGATEERHDPERSVYVIQALAKGDKIETVVQKCTEAGAAGILIVQTERSVVQLSGSKAPERVERWRKVAREAASQSQRDCVPSVEFFADATALSGWLKAHTGLGLLLLDEQERTVGLKQQLQAQPREGYALLVGPEGGWSDAERQLLQSLSVQPVTLGPRILRTETAGLVGLSAILYEFNELGG